MDLGRNEQYADPSTARRKESEERIMCGHDSSSRCVGVLELKEVIVPSRFKFIANSVFAVIKLRGRFDVGSSWM